MYKFLSEFNIKYAIIILFIVFIFLFNLSLLSFAVSNEEGYTKKRKNMIEEQIIQRGIKDKRVISAMRNVPRHLFVPDEYVDRAYGDYPLPIGEGQTISQPYIVALMTELLSIKKRDAVLEIGTGSGYQAAILAELTDNVYTVEIIKELLTTAKERLKKIGYKNIKVKHGDGYYGWKEYAPFDKIIVTTAPDHIPNPLIQQLKDGGTMVIPVGPPGSYQTLWRINKKGKKTEMKNITTVLFVPLLRKVR